MAQQFMFTRIEVMNYSHKLALNASTTQMLCANPRCPRGSLPLASALGLSTHLRLNPACREYLNRFTEDPNYGISTTSVKRVWPSALQPPSSPQFISSKRQRLILQGDNSIPTINETVGIIGSTEVSYPLDFDVDLKTLPLLAEPGCLLPGLSAFSGSSSESWEGELECPHHSQPTNVAGSVSAAAFSIHHNFHHHAMDYVRLEQALEISRQQSLTASRNVNYRCVSDLVKLLEDARVPDGLLKSVLEWGSSSYQEGFNFDPPALGRKSNIAWMEKMLPNAKDYRPKMVEVTGLENHLGEEVTRMMATFDIVPQIMELYTSPDLAQPENFNLNASDPLTMFESPDGALGEPLTGRVYRQMFARIKAKGKTLCGPLIYFLDGTSCTMKGNRELIPVLVTSALFTLKCRRQRKFWRIVGYIPDPSLGMSSAQKEVARRKGPNGDIGKGYGVRNFHRCMEILFRGLKACQDGKDPRTQGVHLKLMGQWVTVDLDLPILFFINDGKQGDQLCGRYACHLGKVKKQHRQCNIGHHDLDNMHAKCTHNTVSHFSELCTNGTVDQLQAVSMYRHQNCFHQLQLGPGDFGIYRAAPLDTLHSVEHGLLFYATESSMKCLPPTVLTDLDDFSISFAKQIRQQSTKLFPRLNFVSGVTNLTRIDCQERVGVVFVICAAMSFPDFHHAMEEAYKRKKNTEYHKLSPNKVRDALERLLVYNEWMKKTTHWQLDDVDSPVAYHAKIQDLMNEVMKAIPRTEGYGWKLSKVHEQLHAIEQMLDYGSVMNYNASTGESNHSFFAKDKAARSSNCHDTLEEQTAERVADAYDIEAVDRIFNPVKHFAPLDTVPDTVTTRATHYCIHRFLDANDSPSVQVVFRSKSKSSRLKLFGALEQDLIDNIRDNEHGGLGCLWGMTEHTWLAQGSKESIRCHPDYDSRGPCYDWAYIRFDKEENERVFFPCRIVGIIEATANGLDEIQLVVQSCMRTLEEEKKRRSKKKEKKMRLSTKKEFITKEEMEAASSHIFQTWIFDHSLHIVPLSSYASACLVFWDVSKFKDHRDSEGMEGITRVVVTTPQSDWGDSF